MQRPCKLRPDSVAPHPPLPEPLPLSAAGTLSPATTEGLLEKDGFLVGRGEGLSLRTALRVPQRGSWGAGCPGLQDLLTLLWSPVPVKVQTPADPQPPSVKTDEPLGPREALGGP